MFHLNTKPINDKSYDAFVTEEHVWVVSVQFLTALVDKTADS